MDQTGDSQKRSDQNDKVDACILQNSPGRGFKGVPIQSSLCSFLCTGYGEASGSLIISAKCAIILRIFAFGRLSAHNSHMTA